MKSILKISPKNKAKKSTPMAKTLLIILSIIGLLFSYSCKCRNSNEHITGGSGKVIQNTISFTNMMIVKSDGTDTAQPITVTIENAQIESWDITDSETNANKKLTKEDFADSANLFANNQNTLKIKDKTSAGKLEASGAEKTVTISFKFKKLDDAAGDATLKQATYSTEIKIKKAVKVTEDKISPALNEKNLLQLTKFLFSVVNGANNEITTQNNSESTTDDDKLNPEDFKTYIINNTLTKDKISPYYTEISDITYTTPAPDG